MIDRTVNWLSRDCNVPESWLNNLTFFAGNSVERIDVSAIEYYRVPMNWPLDTYVIVGRGLMSRTSRQAFLMGRDIRHGIIWQFNWILGNRRSFVKLGTNFAEKLSRYLLPVSVIVRSLETNWLPSGLRSQSSWSTRKSLAISAATNGDGQYIFATNIFGYF